MKLINNILYIEFHEMVNSGATSEGYLKTARWKGVKTMRFIDDPDDNRRSLVEFESLGNKYKTVITEKYGNPYDYVAKEPIRQLVTKDIEAEKFYLSYRFENGNALPIEHINKYTTSASWLNMLLAVEKDKTIAKKKLKLPMASFYQHVLELFSSDNISLPGTYSRLRDKMTDYQGKGYEALINGRFNNSNSAKVKDEISQAILLELISNDSKRDDVVIARAYNNWAKSNGYNPITERTVCNWRMAHESEISLYRNGSREWYNKFGKQIQRKRPSAPMLLWSGDGNDLDLYFRSEKSHYNQFTVVVVIDAFNDYIVGWSLGENENADLIKAAYLDALLHIKELTGLYHLPHQIQSDRFAQTQMKSFFQKIDPEYFPAAARSPRGKYIERTFGTKWHQLLSVFPNYSGNNISSQQRINPERIEREKRNFPDVSEAFNYVQLFIDQLRQDKQAEWLEAFHANTSSQSKCIGDEQFLYHFGVPNKRTQTITNKGLTIQYNGEIYTYEIPDQLFLSVVGRTVQAIHDPYDIGSKVLITDGDKLRVVAYPPTLIPAARADQSEIDQARFFKKLHAKKKHLEAIAASKQKRELILTEEAIDAKALLQAGILDKGLKRSAEITYHQIKNNELPTSSESFDPLDMM